MTIANRPQVRRPAKPQTLTVMVVPRSGSVRSFTVSTRFLRALALTAITLALAVVGFATHYRFVLSQMNELEDLRALTDEQRARIHHMEINMRLLEDDLVRVKQFEERVKQLLQGEQEILQRSPVASGGGTPAGNMISLLTIQAPASLTYRSSPRTFRWNLDEPIHALPESERLSLLQASLRGTLADLQYSLPKIEESLANKIAELRALPTLRPLEGRITSGFGRRRSPFGTGWEFHDGIDIAAPNGTPVLAAGDGKIAAVGFRAGYGRVVVISHGDGLTSEYAHLSSASVKVGDEVKRGQKVGAVGMTGRATGPHLHFGVRVNGQAVDPTRYVK